ncbi:MAG: radical SAM protein, partial [Sulfurimonadaceae bacterium]
AKEHGLKNVFVSNGFESPEVLEDMVLWVDAANIDLKSFSHEYYKKVLKADLDGVLDTLRFLARSPIHLEVTTLLVPDNNNSDEEIEKMARFMAEELGCDIPWHLSAFHPDYKMLSTHATKLSTMERAREIAKSFGIEHMHLGNVFSAI